MQLVSCVTGRFFGGFGRLGARRERSDAGLILGGDAELVDDIRSEVADDELKVADRVVARPASVRLGAVLDHVAVQRTSAVVAR